MGCSFETAKNQNPCSINSRSSSSSNSNNNSNSNKNKIPRRTDSLDNQIKLYKTERRRHSCSNTTLGNTGATSEEQSHQSSECDTRIYCHQNQQHQHHQHQHHRKHYCTADALSCRFNHNCHCPISQDSCSNPNSIPTTPKTTLPVTAAKLIARTATATATKNEKTRAKTTITTTTQIARTLPPDDNVEEPRTNLYADEKKKQKREFERQRKWKQQYDYEASTSPTNDSCPHSCRNATTFNGRGMATAVATACASSSCTVHDMLSQARNVLTARMTHVSNKLMTKISYYWEVAAVATATTAARCAEATQKPQMEKKKLRKRKTKELLQQRTPFCCHRNTSLNASSISGDINATASLLSPSLSSTASSSSSSSSSSLSLSSSSSFTAAAPICNKCDVVSGSMVPSFATDAAAVPVSASGTGMNTAAGAAGAAYDNYIGHNYYHLLRNTISFYAASSVILVLCYLTTTASAAATHTEAAPHPIVNFDWSKFDESSSDKEILDMLLEKKRYDKRLLPPVNGTLTVNVNVLLLSLASPDESSLKYEVEFLLNQQWSDPRLQYGNKSHYDFLNALHHHDSIWTPDTYFIMHGDFKDPIIPMHFALRIYRNGTITYAMRRHLILSCQGSLHIFPFDDPKCSFSMESISYEVAQIKYVWKNDEDTLRKSPSLTSLNAYLIKNQTTACEQTSWRGNYSCLQVALTFTRDRAYYFTTVFIPGIILVTSSFITFWLEWNAVPARVMIGVTTMLNFFTTSNGFRSTLPVVSNLTAMNVWDGVCMCFIYASLLEFVCVNYVGRKRPLHNVVYRPGENPVTQEIIEREFQTALSSEKAAAGLSSAGTTMPQTPTSSTSHFNWERHYGGGMIGAAVKNIRARSLRRRCDRHGDAHPAQGHTHAHDVHDSPMRRRRPMTETAHICTGTASCTTVTVEDDPTVEMKTLSIKSGDIGDERDIEVHIYSDPAFQDDEADGDSDVKVLQRKRLHSMATNTPPLISSAGASASGANTQIDIQLESSLNRNVAYTGTMDGRRKRRPSSLDIELVEHGSTLAVGSGPVRPPRKKTSRSTSPAGAIYDHTVERRSSSATGVASGRANEHVATSEHVRFAANSGHGEKRRDAGAPNEIVACTTCGGSSSPCTHSANNGCATETCFVQVRKKEPPHPIRVAKTIDVIARITFPTAYAIFLIFFFVHYKGFS